MQTLIVPLIFHVSCYKGNVEKYKEKFFFFNDIFQFTIKIVTNRKKSLVFQGPNSR